MEEREFCCCFTGHRPEKLNICEKEMRRLLGAAIETAVKDGFKAFITGMACGVDVWAAEEVLSLKAQLPAIKLICALPYPDFGLRRGSAERRRYERIVSQADFVKTIADKYSYSCFQRRNEWMVDNSSRVIAAFNGAPGGTKNTIAYAELNGVSVIEVTCRQISLFDK